MVGGKLLGSAGDLFADAGAAARLKRLAAAVAAPGRFDATVASLDEARAIVRTAMPDAVELPQAVAGKPYPSPPPGVKQWFQVHPPEPGVNHDMPHIKYADWTAGKRKTGGSSGHIFYPEPKP